MRFRLEPEWEHRSRLSAGNCWPVNFLRAAQISVKHHCAAVNLMMRHISKARVSEVYHRMAIRGWANQIRRRGEKHDVVAVSADGGEIADCVGLRGETGRVCHRDAYCAGNAT